MNWNNELCGLNFVFYFKNDYCQWRFEFVKKKNNNNNNVYLKNLYNILENSLLPNQFFLSNRYYRILL